MTAPQPTQPPEDKFRSNTNRGALIFALFTLLAMALGFLGTGIWGIVENRQARDWPTVSGEIFRSEVAFAGGEYTDTYAPDIAYRYNVGGTEYQGTQVGLSAFKSSTSDRARIAAEVNRYPVGQTVTVHYDPARPAHSALEIPAAPVWPLALGTALLLPLLLLLWLWRRGSLNTLIRTGAVGRRIEYDSRTGTRVTDYDGNTPPEGAPSNSSVIGDSLNTSTIGAEWTYNNNAPRGKGFNPARLAPLLLAVIFGVMAGVFWSTSVKETNVAQQAQQGWQSVTGRIVSSEVVAPQANQYRPSVTYEYEVAGQQYRGDQLGTSVDTSSTSNRTQVAEEVARYIPGKPVKVYYNPQQPSQAALELQSRNSGSMRLMSFIFGGVALLCLLALTVTLRR